MKALDVSATSSSSSSSALLSPSVALSMGGTAAPAAKRRTVMVYTSAFPPDLKMGGGCALRYYTIVKNLLKDSGVKVILLTPLPKDEILAFDRKFESYIENGSLIMESMPWSYNKICPGVKLTYVSFGLMRKIYGMIQTHQVDLLLCPDNVESTVVLALAKLAGAKATVYGIHTDLFKFFFARDIAKSFDISAVTFPIALFAHHIACSRVADHSAVSSEAFRKEISESFWYRFCRLDGSFESLLWSPHFRIPKVSDEEEIRRWRYELTGGNPSSPLLLYVGRWSGEKKTYRLPAAVPRGWRLAFVGDGSDDDCAKVMSLVSENVVARREFIGPKDLAMVYASADFLVSASDFETFGFVALESLACGTPVAVQNAGGFRETIDDGVNGLLVDFTEPEATIARLESFAPGTLNYKSLKQRVISSALESERISDTSFTERLFRRHAPHLLKENVEKYDKVRPATVLRTAAHKVWRGLVTAFLWVFLTVSFLSVLAAQASF